MTTPVLPAIVRGRTRHLRRFPFEHRIGFSGYLWLIDLDASLPRSLFAKWLGKDHFGGALPIREGLLKFAQSQGATQQPDQRLLTLCAPRSLGWVFNPLSVHYCIDADGRIDWAVLEIHNTYGERHAHLLRPTPAGGASVEKEFYVSPFYEVRGTYSVQLKLDETQVLTVVNLSQDGQQVFSASFAGIPVAATIGNRMRAVLRTPFQSLQVSARIRMHGIWLWLRRLPVIKRPQHSLQEGM